MNTIKFLFVINLIFLIGCAKNETKTTDTGKEIALRLEPNEENPRNSEGDFIHLKDGSILFVYTHFTGGTSDYAKAHLAGRYSYDKGKTWTTKDVSILSNEGGMNIMSVSLLRLQNGEIALFYLRKNSETNCIPFMRISTDEAKTWSEPKRCVEATRYHVVNNDRLIQLPSGRIIFPTSIHEAPNWAIGRIKCSYSDDNGTTWLESEQVPNLHNIVLQEPGIVELKNGNLMMFIRTDSGVQYLSYSNDQGISWSPVEPSNIKSPLSPASIERIPITGDLLLLWNNKYENVRDGGKRTPYNLSISKDDGKTWDKIKTVESDPDGMYCYTAIEFIDDHILLGHCAGDTKTNHGLSTTQITRLNMDWVYKDVTSAPVIASEKEGVIELSCKDKDAQIRYSLDGEHLTETTGKRYQKPIVISSITALKMQAFSKSKTPSQIVFREIGRHIFQPAQQLNAKPKEGLAFKYYEGEFRQTEQIADKPELKSGIVSQFSIEKSDRTENFAFVFEGYIKIPKDALYTFYLKSNDGAVMYLNEGKLIDNDGAHGIYERMTSTSLKEGLHKLKVEYFQQGGGFLLEIYWEGEEIPKQKIPQEVLFH